MRRFFAESIDPASKTVELFGDEARHIKNVLRMGVGDEVLLIDGRGMEFASVLSGVGEDSVRFDIIDRRSADSEPCVAVTLFQCLPKQGKMETVIQKCVELGVHEIVPVVSKRCIVKLNGSDPKLARWNKVSVEAAKQCGRAFVPAVRPPIKLEEIDLSQFDLSLVAYENESDTALRSVLCRPGDIGSIAVIIGPEGGFEPSEVERLIASGGVSVSLGKRILRTETAGMAMLAQIMYELDR